MPANVPPVADERDGLLAFLRQQRYVVRLAAYGLTDEQARAAPSASSLSVGGLIKHLTLVERNWTGIILSRSEPFSQQRMERYAAAFQMGPEETLAGILAEYEKAAEETEAVVAGIADLGQPVPVPKDVPWFPKDVEAWSVRWVLLHLIEETARHAGHADIVRESVDGATGFPLMAAAEQWPPNPYLQPWKPATTS